jgi:hypothetical protein
VELYLHSLIRLHGVPLNSLNTRTTSPFYLNYYLLTSKTLNEKLLGRGIVVSRSVDFNEIFVPLH